MSTRSTKADRVREHNRIHHQKEPKSIIISEILEHCANLLDAEERRRIVVLPCAIGDDLFEPRLDRGIISEYRCIGITIDTNNIIFIKWMLVSGIYSRIDGCFSFDIGKTVFLTEAEAKVALEKMEVTP